MSLSAQSLLFTAFFQTDVETKHQQIIWGLKPPSPRFQLAWYKDQGTGTPEPNNFQGIAFKRFIKIRKYWQLFIFYWILNCMYCAYQRCLLKGTCTLCNHWLKLHQHACIKLLTCLHWWLVNAWVWGSVDRAPEPNNRQGIAFWLFKDFSSWENIDNGSYVIEFWIVYIVHISNVFSTALAHYAIPDWNCISMLALNCWPVCTCEYLRMRISWQGPWSPIIFKE